MPATLPDKLYYKIGEVAGVLGVRTSVLRFWETEFSFLKPEKSSSGQRMYSRHEVELISQVKRLLYEEKFTIDGVKKQMSTKRKQTELRAQLPQTSDDASRDIVKEIRQDLRALRDLL
ncbi:MAG TPA: MerR family transcriptional regulator [Desulfuromonadales bacterium]|nr:MerR family transcriptional regulator [Desulfuromonadales bacterium]